MKISSNKAKGGSVKSSSKPEASLKANSDERYSVSKISNGFLIEKSFTDKNGQYQSTKTYSEKNPLDNESSEKE